MVEVEAAGNCKAPIHGQEARMAGRASHVSEPAICGLGEAQGFETPMFRKDCAWWPDDYSGGNEESCEEGLQRWVLWEDESDRF